MFKTYQCISQSSCVPFTKYINKSNFINVASELKIKSTSDYTNVIYNSKFDKTQLNIKRNGIFMFTLNDHIIYIVSSSIGIQGCINQIKYKPNILDTCYFYSKTNNKINVYMNEIISQDKLEINYFGKPYKITPNINQEYKHILLVEYKKLYRDLPPLNEEFVI